jgi:hypothetical protein
MCMCNWGLMVLVGDEGSADQYLELY